MITLDLDLAYISSRYNIGTRDMLQYKNMSIVEIMETEAAKGNSAAAEFLLRITNNPHELAKVLKLADPKNRYLILRNMNKNDLMMVMQFLEPEQLILGLSIFNPEVLVELMKKLPPESLAKVVLKTMDVEKFLSTIPEEFLDQFFTSDKLDRNMIMEAMENIDKEQLQKMMEAYTGQPCYDDKDSIMKNIRKLNDDDFKKALFCFEPKGKQQIIYNIVKERPELFQEFSPEAMTYPFKTMKKEEILKSLSVLETKEMLPMVEDLPQEIMAVIATQIDPEIFAKILCKNFADVIASCGIAA